MSAAHHIGAQEPLVRVDDDDGRPYYRVRVAGCVQPLHMSPGPSHCGTISDGVAFWFGDAGGHFVVSLEALRQIVRLADRRVEELVGPQ